MAEAKKKTTTKKKVEDAVVSAEPVEIVEAPVAETEVEEKATTKAGKHSAKAIAAAEAKAAKEARKASTDEEETESKPKQVSKPTRTRLERRGKGFRKSAEHIEVGKVYGLEEAVAIAQKTSHVKFDATVELHINLNVDPRHADQNIRDNLLLPAGSGKKVRVAVLTDDPAEAIKAGADIAGADDLFKELDKGLMNFDILISTPMLMAKLGKYARVLGPRGLMPNPKSGTVTTDINRAIAESKAGRVEYRVDATGIIHLGVGKVSFTPTQLLENVQAVLASVKSNKPASVKSSYFKALYLTTSMGPSIALDLSSVS